MGHLPQHDDRDLDRLLAGREAPEGLEDLGAFVAGVRERHVAAPRADVEARHLAAMAHTAREHSGATPVASRRRRRLRGGLLPRKRHAALLVRLTATTATAALATAGLAVAGVELPDPADRAFERVGVQLPNQGGDERDPAGATAGPERSGAVLQVIRGTAPEMRGCEFGHRVAAAARGEELPASGRDACAERVPRAAAPAEEREDAAGRSFGEEQSERARDQRTATAEERRRFGRDTADRARQQGERNRSERRRGARPEGAGSPGATTQDPPAGSHRPDGAGRPDAARPPASMPESAAGDVAPQRPPEGTPDGPAEDRAAPPAGRP